MAIEKINTINIAPKTALQNYNDSVKNETNKSEKLSTLKQTQEENKGFNIDKKV